VHRLFPWVEAFWNERAPDAPEFTDDGRFLHRVHPYKLGDAYDAVVFDWHAGSSAEQRRLSLAEGLAFNRGHLSGFGYMGSFAEASFPELDALLSFRRSHPELYVNTHSIAQVGLFESARSLAYNTVDPHYAEVLAMGSLLAGHVPFDLVPELSDEALARHPVLVLAGVECMSDDESRRVLEYVRRGGAAVVTDQTSFYDQWRRRRREPGLFPMLKEAKEFARLEFGRSMATAVSEAQRKKGPTVLKGGFGKGRFAYLPHLQPVKPFVDTPDQWEIGTHYWHLPKNFEAFIDAVRWAGNEKLSVEVTGSTGLAAEARQSADGRIIVHLVNYRLHEASSKVTLTVRGARAATAHVWRPWTLKHEKLPFKPGLEEVSIKVGSVRCYTIVEFK
jgi:hypothetical protein